MMTYVEFADDIFDIKNNIIMISMGLIGLKYKQIFRKYVNGEIIDLFDGRTEICNGDVTLIEKYTKND